MTNRDLDEAVLAAVNKSAEQGGLTNTVRLSIKCENLPNCDTFTRSDGMAVLYKQSGRRHVMLGVTEVIMDNLSPAWVKQFDLQYNFEVREHYRICIYDIDDFDNLLSFEKHDFIGSIDFSLHEVVTSPDQTLVRPLEAPKKRAGGNGLIKVTGEESKRVPVQEIIMRPQANFGGKQTGMVFFLLMKRISAKEWKPMYKSETKPILKGTYFWNMVTMLSTDLVDAGNIDEIFKIEFFQSQKSGKHKNIGHVDLTLAQVSAN